jgi:hypothetical protein
VRASAAKLARRSGQPGFSRTWRSPEHRLLCRFHRPAHMQTVLHLDEPGCRHACRPLIPTSEILAERIVGLTQRGPLLSTPGFRARVERRDGRKEPSAQSTFVELLLALLFVVGPASDLESRDPGGQRLTVQLRGGLDVAELSGVRTRRRSPVRG